MGASGTSWLLNGPAMRTGLVKERNAWQLKTRKDLSLSLRRVNHSTIHRTRKSWKMEENSKDSVPRKLGPADKTIHIREERTTVQLGGASEVAEKWTNGQYAMGTTQRKN